MIRLARATVRRDGALAAQAERIVALARSGARRGDTEGTTGVTVAVEGADDAEGLERSQGSERPAAGGHG